MKAIKTALFASIVAFVMIFALGEAMAGNVPSASDTDNTLTVEVSQDSPTIEDFDINDASYTSFLGDQLDVLSTYYFNVTVEDVNGWADIKWINIRVWYDGGSELAFSAQGTGANYRVDLNYTNVADLNIPVLSEWSVPEGNLQYNSTDSNIVTNTVNQNYTFRLSFQLKGQIRQADDPGDSGIGSYNDANSWNVEIRAKDIDNVDVVSQADSTDVYHEFGVFQYTSVSIGGDWSTPTIAPGGDATTSIVTVTHQANRAYNMTVWFDNILTSNGDTIDVTNINITADGDGGDAITSDTFFAGLLEANEVYIQGGTSTNRSHDVSGNSETTGVRFGVFVPFATPSGTYTADLTMKVEISP